ncbi:hypothetical protein MRX96_049586 [Rhipicephalus microplus]
MTRVGDQTNSSDPAAVNSRIFVGNLNTHVVSKEGVERLFKRYGRIIGLFKHKGLRLRSSTLTHTTHATRCSEKTDRTIAGQDSGTLTWFLNPSLTEVNRKRQNLAPDPFATFRQLDSPVKCARIRAARIPASQRHQRRQQGSSPRRNCARTPSRTSFICGNCREVFPSLQKLLDHKRHRCRLRFTCRCHVVRLFAAESSPVIQLPCLRPMPGALRKLVGAGLPL